jgi:hypothetical protein
MDRRELARLAIVKQYLARRATSGHLVRVVRDIGGLHATTPTTPYLSLFARLTDFTRDQLADALYGSRSLARIRCVRKTIYIHAIADLDSFYAATRAPLVGASRRYARGRGVCEDEYRELAGEILRLLAHRELTAAEIRSTLPTEADISAVLYLMCDEGLLVRGRPVRGWRDRRHRYARFSDWYPGIELNALPEPDAIARVVRRYLAAFGPVTEEDAAWWMGLGKTKIRRALERLRGELVRVSVQGVADGFLVLRSELDRPAACERPAEATARLLPVLDPLLMGYRNRRRFLEEAHRPWVFDRSGNATSTILVDGRVAGVWDFVPGRGKGTPTLKLFFFEEPRDAIRHRVYQEAEGVGRFIARKEVAIEQCATMTPLTHRTAGTMMSPLKAS